MQEESAQRREGQTICARSGTSSNMGVVDSLNLASEQGHIFAVCHGLWLLYA